MRALADLKLYRFCDVNMTDADFLTRPPPPPCSKLFLNSPIPIFPLNPRCLLVGTFKSGLDVYWASTIKFLLFAAGEESLDAGELKLENMKESGLAALSFVGKAQAIYTLKFPIGDQ